MLAKWNILLPLLLGSAAAQQFDDWLYDYDVDYYTATCKDALNKTLQCDSVLNSIVYLNDKSTASQLENLCTDKCKSSLLQTQKDIVKACPVSQNNLTLQHGGFVTAQDNIRDLIDGFTRSCLKDPNTGEFCLPIMFSWPLIENHTREQNCSDCALGAVQLALNLERTYNEEWASEFSVLTESCQKTGFEVTVPTKAFTSGTKSPTTTTTIPCETPYEIHADDTCNGICKSQNVSTYAFTQANYLNIWCDNLPKAGTVVCLPKTCDVYTVQKDDSCSRIVVELNRLGTYFSVTQLLSWNPTINELCSNMEQHVDMQICVSPPGLGHLKPSPASGHDNASITPAPKPNNLANGTNTQCAQYYNITTGDTCDDLSVAAGISLKDFLFLNPSVDKKCSNLILGESYCIRAMGDIDTYPGHTSTRSRNRGKWYYADNETETLGPGWRTELPTPVNTEKPIASGTWDTNRCRVYYEWTQFEWEDLNQEFNSCKEIARRYRTTVETLKKWNPSLAEASPCIIKKKDRYCVYLRDEYRSSAVTTTIVEYNPTQVTPSATSSSQMQNSTTKTTAGIPTPSNAAPDTIAGCKDFYEAISGDYCYQICEDNKITQEDFIKWNPSVKKDCSLIQKGLSYCVKR